LMGWSPGFAYIGRAQVRSVVDRGLRFTPLIKRTRSIPMLSHQSILVRRLPTSPDSGLAFMFAIPRGRVPWFEPHGK
jgi:hypothetical protein